MKLLFKMILIFFALAPVFCQQPQQTATDGAVFPNAASEQPSGGPLLRSGSLSSVQISQDRAGIGPADLHGQLEMLKDQLAGRRGLIEIPPGSAAGWWPGLNSSNLRFLDDRGNSMPDSNGNVGVATIGGYKVGFANGLLFRASETDPGSPDHYTGFANVQFHYAADRGGLNNFTGRGQKTDYFNILATSEMRTVGQKSGVTSRIFSYSSGDTMGLQSYITQFGGYDTSGDEQTEGLRIQAQQGSAAAATSGGVFEGIVKAVDGNKMTYSATEDESTLGEHRMIRDLDRSYAAGSVATIVNSGGSPNTVRVTGTGTHWSELGKGNHTNWNNLAAGGNVTDTTLAFCFDPLKGDGYDTCFPVNEITDDTHLTLNIEGVGTQQNTPWPQSWPNAGSYKMYSAAWPTSVDTEAHTISAPTLSGITVGHRIDQVLAYNMQVYGEWIALSRHIGIPGKGAGIHIVNWGAPGSPSMGYGVGISGAFDSALAI